MNKSKLFYNALFLIALIGQLPIATGCKLKYDIDSSTPKATGTEELESSTELSSSSPSDVTPQNQDIYLMQFDDELKSLKIQSYHLVEAQYEIQICSKSDFTFCLHSIILSCQKNTQCNWREIPPDVHDKLQFFSEKGSRPSSINILVMGKGNSRSFYPKSWIRVRKNSAISQMPNSYRQGNWIYPKFCSSTKPAQCFWP